MSEVLVILPTYNEVENLPRLVPSLLDLSEAIGVVVVDDNSPDGTGAVAETLREERGDRVTVLHRHGKLGLGTAYLAGFATALSGAAEFVVTMDADFSHHPRHILSMLEMAKTQQKDLVIGSRYVAGGETPDFPFSRKLLSGGANIAARHLAGLESHDATSGFRCYRRATLEALPLDEIVSNGYSFLVEILFMIQNVGFDVGEVPIVFRDREHGKSKISKREVYKAILTVTRLAGFRAARWLNLSDEARRVTSNEKRS